MVWQFFTKKVTDTILWSETQFMNTNTMFLPYVNSVKNLYFSALYLPQMGRVPVHTPRWSHRLCKSPYVCVNPSKQLYVSVSLNWFPVVAYVILTIVRLLSSHRTSEIRISQLTNHKNSATGRSCCQSISHQRKTPNNGIQKKPKGVTRS